MNLHRLNFMLTVLKEPINTFYFYGEIRSGRFFRIFNKMERILNEMKRIFGRILNKALLDIGKCFDCSLYFCFIKQPGAIL